MGCGCNKKGTPPVKKGTPPAKLNVETNVNIKKGFTLPEPEIGEMKEIVIDESIKKPSLLKKALNLGEAVMNHVADGMTKATNKEFTVRMDICHNCPERDNTTCTKCGCELTIKAAWRSSTCPMDKWPELKQK